MKYILLFYIVQLKTQLLYCPDIANGITSFIDKGLLTNTILKEKQDWLLFFILYIIYCSTVPKADSPVGFLSLVHHVVMYYLQGFFVCFTSNIIGPFTFSVLHLFFVCLAVFWNALDLVNKHLTIIITWHAKSYIEFSLLMDTNCILEVMDFVSSVVCSLINYLS